MGLLDALGSDEGLLGLALMAGGAAKPVRTGLGEGLLQGMQLVQQNRNAREDRAQRMRMQQMQEQAMQMQMEERKRMQQQQAQRGQYLNALDANQGPPMQMTPAGALAAGLSPQEMSILAPQQAKAPEFKVVGGSLVKIGPDGVSEAYRAPEKPEAAPSSVREYQFAVSQGYKGSFQQYQLEQRRAGATNVGVSYGAPVAGVDASGNPVFFQPAKGGGAPSIVPGVSPPKKDMALTEAQAKAATFKSQMEAAERELSGNPIDMTKLYSQVDVGMAGGPTNILSSPTAQRARQAQEQWAESFLRFKTGAAATEQEVKLNVRTFFPQPGDSAAVIEQKKRARAQAARDIAFAAGQQSSAPPVAAPDADPLGLRK